MSWCKKSTYYYLALYSHVCSRNRRIWGSINYKYATWSTSSDMHCQIEWMIVWLWTISSTSTTLLACNCSVCFLQFKLWWLCWPCIQVGKHFQSLSTSFSFPWKWRHMTSIFRSVFYGWSFKTTRHIKQVGHYSNT